MFWPFSRKPKVPEFKLYMKIYNERYVTGKRWDENNDCSNKSGKYCRMLRELGYHAQVVVVKLLNREQHSLHAIVKVSGLDGKCDTMYIDVTCKHSYTYWPDHLWQRHYYVTTSELYNGIEFVSSDSKFKSELWDNSFNTKRRDNSKKRTNLPIRP